MQDIDETGLFVTQPAAAGKPFIKRLHAVRKMKEALGIAPETVILQLPEMRFTAQVGDEPVPGTFATVSEALEAARAALPEGNAVGHLCDVTAEARHEFAADRGPGEWEPAGSHLYCLAVDGRWREVR